MSEWIAKALSDFKNPLSQEEEQIDFDKEVVLFMQGNNSFGDKVYSYVKLSLRNVEKMMAKVKSKEDFFPSDFGTVLFAGTGEPTPELRSEMAVTYNLVDVKPPLPAKSLNFAQPSVWDE